MAAKIEPQLILEAAILIRRATCPTAMPLMTAGIAALGTRGGRPDRQDHRGL